ncbi:MAG: aminopeptidase P family protein [Rhodospirillales bacterium]|nr:aminopeptidase P family protein [Rhodospirillales bacterium]MBT4039704.1 aminopeptidase P family protein [Rhodospirillales bacterium]MBT5351187.1 aminopeptidase P family protein [Rhodospirillales bacterium]MBT6827403.1 aminopeptidase P family protein [Rhodospirillales bacterium]MBT7147003.1 aminopeptidase P family protein [Rhodospirillales bacterium]
MRSYRLDRIRSLMAEADVAGLVLFDPVNIRYATGSRNMQVWTMHNPCRYAFIATGGPVIMFDLGSSKHLAAGLETIDEIRPASAWDYMMVGSRNNEMAAKWAAEIADLVDRHGGGNKRLAMDRADWLPVQALQKLGVEIEDGKAITERARQIKSTDEIKAMRISFDACEESIAVLKSRLKPGMRENEALGILMQANLDRGGEYPETRLLSSGPRTNPWFQETSDRVMEVGDLMSFDTDLIGPYGIYTDISRSWVVGGGLPTDEQRRLYELSARQLDHNIALLRPGMGFVEYGEKSYPLPGEFLANRYADVAHGCGMGVEYPLILYPEDEEHGLYDGVFEAGMVVCVESYIGAVGAREGVKLEQPVLITENGPELFITDCPLEDDYF